MKTPTVAITVPNRMPHSGKFSECKLQKMEWGNYNGEIFMECENVMQNRILYKGRGG